MKEIEKFKELINLEEYYNAHEALEELWFPIRKSKDNYCLLLKGFINAAVSLELHKRGKIEQSKKTYLIYKKYVNSKRLELIKNELKFKNLKKFLDLIFKYKNIH